MKMICTIGTYLVGLCLLAGTGCQSIQQKEMDSPPGYDFSKGEKLFLINRLEEVSGIAFVPETDSLLVAVNDEEGKVFKINVNDPKFIKEPVKFAKSGDYEDIAFLAGKWRVLESNGTIFSLDSSLEREQDALKQKILPKGEYEGMASWNDTLFVICKECPTNKKTDATLYKIKATGDSLFVAESKVIDLMAASDGKSKKYLASALAKHPITGEWFILSHLRGGLIITDESFKVKQFIRLVRSQFTQPEGIAFAPNGDLLISSEGDEAAGYILRFTYNR